jgi:mannosyl-glycoprotein endo-beta-N-acetylglucosaminidase
VLGTFITEWDAGAATCAAAFSTMAAAEAVAERLASIAAQYGFEGWLINIENGMRPEHIVRLRHFLRCVSPL